MMGSIVTGLLLTPVVATGLWAQLPFQLEGHWAGAVSRGGAIQNVEIDIQRGAGVWQGTYSIPELGLYAEPLSGLAVGDSTVAFRIIYGPFELRINRAELQMTALNSNWGPPVAMHLKREQKVPAYVTHDLVVEADNAHIAATLYRPTSVHKPPVVVIAGGSSQQTRQNWEYRGWGPSLAARGVAVVVYDRRGHGASTGDSLPDLLRTEASDIAAIVSAVTQRSDLDSRRVGVIGASRGGWTGLLAALETKKIRFVVLECAPAVGPMEQELQRIRHTELTDSLVADDLREAEAFARLTMEAVHHSELWPQVSRASEQARAARWRAVVQIPDSLQDLDWWRENDVDQRGLLRALGRPVFALFGGDDRIVPPTENVEPMRAALEQGGSVFTIHVVPRAGHGLFSFGTLYGRAWSFPEKYWIWSSKAAGVFDSVAAWIHARN